MEHSQGQILTRNQRRTNSRMYPELVMTPTAADREATYYAALNMVAQIDEDLTRGTRHYRNRAGLLLTTLDEVVRAILDDDLLLPEEQPEDGVVWVTPQKLVA